MMVLGYTAMNTGRESLDTAKTALAESTEPKEFSEEILIGLVEAARGVATAAATKGVTSLSDTLKERTAQLQELADAADKVAPTSSHDAAD